MSFISGGRDCCRLTLGPKESAVIVSSIRDSGLFLKEIYIETHEIGTDWAGFRRTDDVTDTVMLVLSKSKKNCDRLTSAELVGDYVTSGRLLDYPTCCIQSYPEVATHSHNWPLFYLNQSRSVSAWCNRFTCIRSSACPTGYLFPCSLTCREAILQGQRNLAAFDLFSLRQLANKILEESKAPLCFIENEVILAKDLSAKAESQFRIEII